jgi:hypothetical protein
MKQKPMTLHHWTWDGRRVGAALLGAIVDIRGMVRNNRWS